MDTRISLSEEDARKYAYHSTKSDANIFHLCRNCIDGNDIEKEYRCAGKGDNTDLCEKCRELIQNNNCNLELEEMVKSRDKGLDNFRKMQKKNPNLK